MVAGIGPNPSSWQSSVATGLADGSADRPRFAVVTGGTDGIGKATARSLLARGWTVLVIGRSEARCEATVVELDASAPTPGCVQAVVADLSRMADVRRAAQEIEARIPEALDLLVLNANAITGHRVLTTDGFESNFALGYLGRALLSWALQDLMCRSRDSQVLSVVGLNLDRVDPIDPMPTRGFSSMAALGRWQWAAAMFCREWNHRLPSVAMNTFMPGLVRTKILNNEPQPMRLVVQIANFVMGISTRRSGDELVTVVETVQAVGYRDTHFYENATAWPTHPW